MDPAREARTKTRKARYAGRARRALAAGGRDGCHATTVPDTVGRGGRRLARVRGDDGSRPARRAVADALQPHRPRQWRPRRDSRRRFVRDDGRVRAWQSRLRLPGARSAGPAGRPRLHGPPRHASEETGAAQTAAFDDGLYFNAGPMRISHHHHTTLAYCRELQVATEVFVPDCESAYLAQTRGPLAGTPHTSSRGPRRFRRLHRRAVEQVALAGATRSAADRRGSRSGAGVSPQPWRARPRLASTAARSDAAPTRRSRCAICSAGSRGSTCRPTGRLNRR